MPRVHPVAGLPLATVCRDEECMHSLNWHDTLADRAPCRSAGCPCKAFAFRVENGEPVRYTREELAESALRKALDRELQDAARSRQVGGDHYTGMAMQPWDIWEALDLGAFEGAILKYLLRRKGDSRVEDLKKARHTLDRLIEIEERRG